MKTMSNTCASDAKLATSDVTFFGDGDLWKLISKAHSKSEGWMKSTKAMEVPGGCVVQVSTQQGERVAEAITFVPGVRIEEHERDGKVYARSLVGI